MGKIKWTRPADVDHTGFVGDREAFVVIKYPDEFELRFLWTGSAFPVASVLQAKAMAEDKLAAFLAQASLEPTGPEIEEPALHERLMKEMTEAGVVLAKTAALLALRTFQEDVQVRLAPLNANDYEEQHAHTLLSDLERDIAESRDALSNQEV